MKNESGYRYFNRMIAQNCTAGRTGARRSGAREERGGRNDASVVIYGDRGNREEA